MARVLLRLKLALLRAGLASAGIQGRVGAALALAIALLAGGLGGLLLAVTRLLDDGQATALTSGGYAVLLVMWVLGPIITAGAEGTLDPSRLALLPLSRRQLMPGLLLAALVGFGGLLTVLVLAGSVVGMTPVSPLLPVVPLAAACHLLLCAALSRLVATALSGAVQSRRWRDVALFVAPLTAVALNVLGQVVNARIRTGDTGSLGRFASLGRALGGPAALAVNAARTGEALGAVVGLVAAAAAVVAAVALWGAALARALTAAGGGGTRNARLARPLRPIWIRLPRGRMGAVAAKELRLSWRDPRQRAALLGLLVGALVPLFSFRLLGSSSPRVALAAALPAFVLGTQSTNQFGYDGPAHWTNVASGEGRARTDLLGKNLAKLVLSAPLVALAVVVFTSRTGSATFVVPALGLSILAFGIAMGLGNWFSVTSPVPLPDSSTNVFSSGNAGQGMAAAGPALAVLFGGGVLLLPLLVPMLLVDGVAWLQALGLLGVVGGLAAWRTGLTLAARHLDPRQPELLIELETKT